MHHEIDELAVAELVAEARLRDGVRRVRHRLHAAGHDHIVVAGADHRVRDLHGADARCAHLVDRVRGHVDRQAGADRGLPRRRLAGAALEHLSHDGVLDVPVLDAHAVERAADGDRAQLGRLLGRETAAELPERRAYGRDDDGASHGAESIDPIRRFTRSRDTDESTRGEGADA